MSENLFFDYANILGNESKQYLVTSFNIEIKPKSPMTL
mgnify:CR=1 FL=1|jgi:hypothetical protein